ncbi:hypothetical protein P168DRAFT_304336 [Aspergillus campestris IBT 28561]|uniref:Uncharacterized protein n=1 Tax=Aspergillus campestris (strain IBT 28561) TaxID=1392248 RepID=A0A2I1D621_ASPC2|nr:uncharacterized protein P168DRAFT_304336 [Aspergillus campestris IBT 28561]PKY05320.1 hypothetical protein P168DRAFT_304336 [Aspergillus campestris IBT 28561]
MCPGKDYADVYPIEIRTKKVTRRSLFNLSTEPSRRTQTQDWGRYQQSSYSLPRISQTMRVPRFHIIEPREQNRECHAEESPARHWIPRSRSFQFDLPSIRRFTDRVGDPELRPSRRRDRSPRPFAVDSPEVITRILRRPRRSTFTQTSSDSLQDSDADGFEDTESEDDSDSSSSCSPRYSRPSRPTRNPRPPRERTPVSEREPMRTRQRRTASRPVEIHQSNSPIHDSDGERNMGRRRQVRFSEEVDYVQNTRRAREHSIASKLGGRRRASFDHSNQKTPHVRVDNRRDSFNSSPSLRHRSPPFGETRGTERTFANRSRTSRMSPRIIQDGRRQISEAAVRIYAEARSRRSYADLGNNLRSYTVWGRSCPSDRSRASRSDELRTSFDDTERYGYGRRGRWR